MSNGIVGTLWILGGFVSYHLIVWFFSSLGNDDEIYHDPPSPPKPNAASSLQTVLREIREMLDSAREEQVKIETGSYRCALELWNPSYLAEKEAKPVQRQTNKSANNEEFAFSKANAVAPNNFATGRLMDFEKREGVAPAMCISGVIIAPRYGMYPPSSRVQHEEALYWWDQGYSVSRVRSSRKGRTFLVRIDSRAEIAPGSRYQVSPFRRMQWEKPRIRVRAVGTKIQIK